jgi:hypothetical protein
LKGSKIKPNRLTGIMSTQIGHLTNLVEIDLGLAYSISMCLISNYF